MNDEEFEEYLKDQEEIKKHNDLEMQKVHDMIQKRKDKLGI
jgi:hypothetical protein